MAKVRTDMLKIQKEPYKLDYFVEHVLEDFKKFANTHQIVVDIPKDPPDLYFDFNLFELALIQILKNAVTYTPKGSKIYISAKLNGETEQLSIADEGPGIPPELLGRIFDRFYRIPGTSATGTGLGLALAKSIVEIHGGTIEASNRPEGGAEFRINLNIGP
jgi:two-component system sensor histidine kinase KdpD